MTSKALISEALGHIADASNRLRSAVLAAEDVQVEAAEDGAAELAAAIKRLKEAP